MFFVVLVKPRYQTKLWKTTTKAYRKYRVVIVYKPKDQKFTLNLYWSMSNIWNRGLIVWNFRFGLPFASLFLAALVRWMLLKFARSKFYCQKKQTKRWELCEKKQGMICGENDNAPYWTMLHVVYEDFVMDADAQGKSCSSVAVTYMSSWEIEKLTKIGYVTSLVFWFSGLMRFKQGSRSRASADIDVNMTWYILVVHYIHIRSLYSYTYTFSMF